MKKFFLSITAVILIVAASAFMKSNIHSKDLVYHWYNVDSIGFVVSGSEAFNGLTETVSYASSHLPCPFGFNSDCIRGFTNIPSLPTSARGDTAPLQKQ